ncbi:MAG: crossover junction endodeoxyribonuclease RuvC [Bacteroidetes bacterium]|jgi:crossover junction endodeoxyribonuclease RuvC|nr:crossover junction endodeoxyribonuclease RuvC [Bacteroidota bacterium]MBP7257641.1 crossover junction endodeoxyribonuclease RuvC [Chitinophagales bacterium]MBK7505561.1 crossover junction endodeoxyribonuclease RuvC [Bacteroidota bacterium]MBK7641414.1 crossover junction endodeoxyribonuclease RuvC [Bacteroidota bacterium]MBK8673442.1 crossover junction endodeoxyribonuclease RuvC [Bacteroidota bacterium]
MNSKATTQKNIILGIDPGSNVTGYGVILSSRTSLELLHIGSLHLDKYEDSFQRMEIIFKKVSTLIDTYQPIALAIEAPFFAKNVQSMLKLGRAQGMAIAAALNKGVDIFEYSPKKVKQSVTGNGNAAKEQVAAMLGHILKTDALPKQLDATDGLAVAICHHFCQYSVASSGKKYNSWNAFISDNPKKVSGK